MRYAIFCGMNDPEASCRVIHHHSFALIDGDLVQRHDMGDVLTEAQRFVMRVPFYLGDTPYPCEPPRGYREQLSVEPLAMMLLLWPLGHDDTIAEFLCPSRPFGEG
jgi:hypothetical protein